MYSAAHYPSLTVNWYSFLKSLDVNRQNDNKINVGERVCRDARDK